PGPARLALRDLDAAFGARGIPTERLDALPPDRPAVVVGVGRDSALVRRVLADGGWPVPEKKEEVLSKLVLFGGQRVRVLAGGDGRGLSYGLLDAARAVELAPRDRGPLVVMGQASETPFLAVRAVSVHPANADCDAGWYFSERFWRTYFADLARHRFNTFVLT